MIKEKLVQIGLTPGESEVYEILVEIGSSTAGSVIKKSHLASSKVYDILMRLVKKGLASFAIKNGVKYYEATPPERLIDFLEEKKEDLTKAQTEMKKIISVIKNKSEGQEKNNVRMFIGKQGPKIVLKELVEESRKDGYNYGYGTEENPFMEYYPHELNDFFKAEKKYKLKTLLIFAAGHIHKQPNANVRYLPRQFLAPVRTMIAGSKVFMVDFTEPYTSIIIENKQIAQSYIDHFKFLWKQAKK